MTRGFAAAEYTSRDGKAAGYMAEAIVSVRWALLCCIWSSEI